MIKLAIDVMGGDNAPQAILEGCLQALEQSPSLFLYASGEENANRSILTGRR